MNRSDPESGSKPTEEQVRNWLRMAERREINVFVDHCAIIKTLCRTLLEERGAFPFSGGGPGGGK